MPWNPENIFVGMLALLAFASLAQAELINHTYCTYIITPFFTKGILDNRLVEPILIIKVSQSNRELVVDFLSYKLSKKGYSWSQFSDMEENRAETPEGTESGTETPNAINGNPSWHLTDSSVVDGATVHSRSLDARKLIPMTTVEQALREASNEFELRYQQTFSNLTSQLHITPGTTYQSFEQVRNGLFRDGGNWGGMWPFSPSMEHYA